MREFLTNLNIVGCVNVWQEGKLLKYCLDNLLQYCNYIVVMMDNPDKETEDFVKLYQKTYPQIFRIGYTNIPKLETSHPNPLRRREKIFKSELVEAKLKLVREIQEKEKPINILLTPGSDEIFTDYLPVVLEEFWQRPETSICMRSLDVYNNMYAIHDRGMMSHWRVYKYTTEINFTPRRFQDHYHVYPAAETWHGLNGTFVHLSQLEKFQEFKSKHFAGKRFAEVAPNAKIWLADKPVYKLTPQEYHQLCKREPDFLLKEYDELVIKSGGVRKKLCE